MLLRISNHAGVYLVAIREKISFYKFNNIFFNTHINIGDTNDKSNLLDTSFISINLFNIAAKFVAFIKIAKYTRNIYTRRSIILFT